MLVNKYDLVKEVESVKVRSCWNKGVKEYTFELVESLFDDIIESDQYDYINRFELKELLLNGAENWKQYSRWGNGLIYSGDIAERLCTPSELKRDILSKRPNKYEDWLDVQARALHQAFELLVHCIFNVLYFNEEVA